MSVHDAEVGLGIDIVPRLDISLTQVELPSGDVVKQDSVVESRHYLSLHIGDYCVPDLIGMFSFYKVYHLEQVRGSEVGNLLESAYFDSSLAVSELEQH